MSTQNELLVFFFVDTVEPARLFRVPNQVRDSFKLAMQRLEKMQPWPMGAFDNAREAVYREYPNVQALWSALAEQKNQFTAPSTQKPAAPLPVSSEPTHSNGGEWPRPVCAIIGCGSTQRAEELAHRLDSFVNHEGIDICATITVASDGAVLKIETGPVSEEDEKRIRSRLGITGSQAVTVTKGPNASKEGPRSVFEKEKTAMPGSEPLTTGSLHEVTRGLEEYLRVLKELVQALEAKLNRAKVVSLIKQLSDKDIGRILGLGLPVDWQQRDPEQVQQLRSIIAEIVKSAQSAAGFVGQEGTPPALMFLLGSIDMTTKGVLRAPSAVSSPMNVSGTPPPKRRWWQFW